MGVAWDKTSSANFWNAWRACIIKKGGASFFFRKTLRAILKGVRTRRVRRRKNKNPKQVVFAGQNAQLFDLSPYQWSPARGNLNMLFRDVLLPCLSTSFEVKQSEKCFQINLRDCDSFSIFFPRASERRVLPIVGVCISSSHLHIFSSSHLLIFTSSHLHIFSLHIFSSSHLLIFTSSHLYIFTSSDLHIFSSSHLLIFTSSHLHICSSSHLLILTSSHLHILTFSHPHIFTSCPLALLPSCPLALLPSCPLALLPSCPLALLPSCPLALFYFSSEGGGRGSANETARNATLSHETRFDRQKLRENCDFRVPVATLSHDMKFDRQKLR